MFSCAEPSEQIQQLSSFRPHCFFLQWQIQSALWHHSCRMLHGLSSHAIESFEIMAGLPWADRAPRILRAPGNLCWACARAGPCTTGMLACLQHSWAIQVGSLLINSVCSCLQTNMNIKLQFQLLAHFLNHQTQLRRFICYQTHSFWSQFIKQGGIMPLLIKMIFSPSSDFSFHSLLLTTPPAFVIVLQNSPTKI